MNRAEQRLHIACVSFLRQAAPDLAFFHPANGGYRTPREAALFKALGVRAGVPDLCLILAPEGRAAFIEFKSAQGRPSAAQTEFAGLCDRSGALWAVARSLGDLEAILLRWEVPLRARAKSTRVVARTAYRH